MKNPRASSKTSCSRRTPSGSIRHLRTKRHRSRDLASPVGLASKRFSNMLASQSGVSRNMVTSLYASPRAIDDANDCYFYHTMDIPGHGLVRGEWDLRKGVREYLGGVDFKGKRVLELGTASGFLCFHMEKEGAEVVAYDLSEDQSWDVVPFARGDTSKVIAARKAHIRKL